MKRKFSEEFVKTIFKLCIECEDAGTDYCEIRVPSQEGTLVVTISFDAEYPEKETK